MRERQNIAIVGSGFLGLTLALRFVNDGHRVTVFESSPAIGGLASVWQIGGITWDRHYHVTLLSDAFTKRLVGELGLAEEFEWVETKTGFYTDGKLASMSDTLEFLKFPPLGLISKFRLGATIFYASRVKNWKKLEKISVEEWLTKLSGKKTFEKMWKPLLKAKLGDAYRETSAAFIWATIQRMYAARNSGLKKEMFGYVRGGYARVLSRFLEVLHEKGVQIRLNTRVEEIFRDNGEIAVATANAATYEVEIQSDMLASAEDVVVRPLISDAASTRFDKVILTCPSNIAARILPQLTEKEKRKLDQIKYQGIVCASVLMKKPISQFYVTNITDETPFTGIIEMSALVDRDEFGGNCLVYLPKYTAPDSELFSKTDADIEESFLAELERMYPHFRRSDVLAFKVSRVREVFPVPTINYSENVPSVSTSIPGVFILNSAQITNGTLNVNETVQLAEKFFNSTFSISKNLD